QPVIEQDGFDLPQAAPLHRYARVFSVFLTGRTRVSKQICESGCVQVPLIKSDGAVFDDTRDDAGFRLARTDGADATVTVGYVVDVAGNVAGCQDGVFTPVHRSRAGVGRLAVETYLVPLDPVGAKHHAQRQAELLQDGAL